MGKFFSMLLEKITAVIAWFSELAVAVFKAAWDFAKDVICWSLDQESMQVILHEYYLL